MFQSTRPRGARLRSRTGFLTKNKFQSTRPRGARQNIELSVEEYYDVSIHAPAGGATVINAASDFD